MESEMRNNIYVQRISSKGLKYSSLSRFYFLQLQSVYLRAQNNPQISFHVLIRQKHFDSPALQVVLLERTEWKTEEREVITHMAKSIGKQCDQRVREKEKDRKKERKRVRIKLPQHRSLPIRPCSVSGSWFELRMHLIPGNRPLDASEMPFSTTGIPYFLQQEPLNINSVNSMSENNMNDSTMEKTIIDVVDESQNIMQISSDHINPEWQTVRSKKRRCDFICYLIVVQRIFGLPCRYSLRKDLKNTHTQTEIEVEPSLGAGRIDNSGSCCRTKCGFIYH
ncbi:hypothetical protein C0J52_13666 [Blattella germanica]|nr:hypothetical protein C0J52_13666 [Blattella germanica]